MVSDAQKDSGHLSHIAAGHRSRTRPSHRHTARGSARDKRKDTPDKPNPRRGTRVPSPRRAHARRQARAPGADPAQPTHPKGNPGTRAIQARTGSTPQRPRQAVRGATHHTRWPSHTHHTSRPTADPAELGRRAERKSPKAYRAVVRRRTARRAIGPRRAVPLRPYPRPPP